MSDKFRSTSSGLSLTASSAGSSSGTKAAFTQSAVRETERQLVIDVGKQTDKAVVLRQGLEVPYVEIDRDRLSESLLGLKEAKAKVVDQSIKSGTKVPRGTSVTLTLASAGKVKADVLAGHHRQLGERSLQEVYDGFLLDSTLLKAVAGNEDPGTLSAGERDALTKAAQSNDIQLSEDDPELSLDALYLTLRGSYAYGAGS